MPPRQELPDLGAYRARDEHRRVQNRLAQRRHRARQHDAVSMTTGQHDTPSPPDAAPAQARARTRGPGPSLSEKDSSLLKTGGLGDVDHTTLQTILGPFATNRDPYNPALWDRLHTRYPAVDLILEAM